MSRIVVVSYMSLDGMTSSDEPGKVVDWLPYDSSLDQLYIDAYRDADAVLFGRRSFEALKSYWPTEKAKNEPPELTRLINTLPKVVFSNSHETSDWKPSRFIKDVSQDSVEMLLRDYPRGLLAIGSGTVVSQLAALGLIDEMRLIVAPVVLAKGKPYFRSLESNLKLDFLGAKPYGNGNLVVRYGKPHLDQTA